MKPILIAAASMLALTSTLHAQSAEKSENYTVIELNDEKISNEEVLETWESLFPNGDAPDFASFDDKVKQNVLRGLISEKLIYEQAQKANYDEKAVVKQRIETMKRQVVMQEYMEDKAEALVTEEKLKAAYDAKRDSIADSEEIKARHILVADEEEAKKIRKQIVDGKDFAALAKEQSTDKGSGMRGGDLGYFTEDKMVPEFASAAFKLEKGDISEPVKSPFGWHIIKVEDRRAVTMPTFEDAKEALRAELAEDAMQNYIEGLLNDADITYYTADGSEQPFSRKLLEEPIAP